MEWIVENPADNEISTYSCVGIQDACKKWFCLIEFGGVNCPTRSCGLYIA